MIVQARQSVVRLAVGKHAVSQLKNNSVCDVLARIVETLRFSTLAMNTMQFIIINKTNA
jgi:hypothetical protein